MQLKLPIRMAGVWLVVFALFAVSIGHAVAPPVTSTAWRRRLLQPVFPFWYHARALIGSSKPRQSQRAGRVRTGSAGNRLEAELAREQQR